jgi:hypothetical protein
MTWMFSDSAVRLGTMCFPETGCQENRRALKLADGTWRWSDPAFLNVAGGTHLAMDPKMFCFMLLP